MSKITLNDDQINASTAFTKFLMDDTEKYFVISGDAGSGKSTLIKHLLDTLADKYKMVNMLKQRSQKQLDIALTATTNKAVAVLREMENAEPKTIHSFLKLTLKPNFATGETDLIKSKECQEIHNHLILIDEASFIDQRLFDFIDNLTPNCKVVLVGDQYQLAPVRQKTTIMEALQCPKVELKQIIRNAGVIKSTGQQFKQTVKTGQFQSLVHAADGKQLRRVDGPTFQTMIETAFTDPQYNPGTAKILAWTNERVIAYNDHIRHLKGYAQTFEPGEVAVTNNPIQMRGLYLPIESMVYITDVEPTVKIHNIAGNYVTINGSHKAFLPAKHTEVKALLKKFTKAKAWGDYFQIKDSWLDLRPNYASTVHKSQGSTYETAFIDLSDIGKCHIPSDVARMVYVAITRASKQVVLYGDLPIKYRG